MQVPYCFIFIIVLSLLSLSHLFAFFFFTLFTFKNFYEQIIFELQQSLN